MFVQHRRDGKQDSHLNHLSEFQGAGRRYRARGCWQLVRPLAAALILFVMASNALELKNQSITSAPTVYGCGFYTMSYKLWCGPGAVTSYVALLSDCAMASAVAAQNGGSSSLVNGSIALLPSGLVAASTCPPALAFTPALSCSQRTTCTADWPGPGSSSPQPLCLLVVAGWPGATIPLTACDLFIEGQTSLPATAAPSPSGGVNRMEWWHILLIIVAGLLTLLAGAAVLVLLWRCCCRTVGADAARVVPTASRGNAASIQPPVAAAAAAAGKKGAIQAANPSLPPELALVPPATAMKLYSQLLQRQTLDNPDLYVPDYNKKPATMQPQQPSRSSAAPLPGSVPGGAVASGEPPGEADAKANAVLKYKASVTSAQGRQSDSGLVLEAQARAGALPGRPDADPVSAAPAVAAAPAAAVAAPAQQAPAAAAPPPQVPAVPPPQSLQAPPVIAGASAAFAGGQYQQQQSSLPPPAQQQLQGQQQQQQPVTRSKSLFGRMFSSKGDRKGAGGVDADNGSGGRSVALRQSATTTTATPAGRYHQQQGEQLPQPEGVRHAAAVPPAPEMSPSLPYMLYNEQQRLMPYNHPHNQHQQQYPGASEAYPWPGQAQPGGGGGFVHAPPGSQQQQPGLMAINPQPSFDAGTGHQHQQVMAPPLQQPPPPYLQPQSGPFPSTGPHSTHPHSHPQWQQQQQQLGGPGFSSGRGSSSGMQPQIQQHAHFDGAVPHSGNGVLQPYGSAPPASPPPAGRVSGAGNFGGRGEDGGYPGADLSRQATLQAMMQQQQQQPMFFPEQQQQPQGTPWGQPGSGPHASPPLQPHALQPLQPLQHQLSVGAVPQLQVPPVIAQQQASYEGPMGQGFPGGGGGGGNGGVGAPATSSGPVSAGGLPMAGQGSQGQGGPALVPPRHQPLQPLQPLKPPPAGALQPLQPLPSLRNPPPSQQQPLAAAIAGSSEDPWVGDQAPAQKTPGYSHGADAAGLGAAAAVAAADTMDPSLDATVLPAPSRGLPAPLPPTPRLSGGLASLGLGASSAAAPLAAAGSGGGGVGFPPPGPATGGIAPLVPLPGPRKLKPMARKPDDDDDDDEDLSGGGKGAAGGTSLRGEPSFGDDRRVAGPAAGGGGAGGGGGLEEVDDDFDVDRPPPPRRGGFL